MKEHFKKNKEKVDYIVTTDLTLSDKKFKSLKDIKLTEKETLGEFIDKLVAEVKALTEQTIKLRQELNDTKDILDLTVRGLANR